MAKNMERAKRRGGPNNVLPETLFIGGLRGDSIVNMSQLLGALLVHFVSHL
jgi:hypothetical protein